MSGWESPLSRDGDIPDTEVVSSRLGKRRRHSGVKGDPAKEKFAICDILLRYLLFLRLPL